MPKQVYVRYRFDITALEGVPIADGTQVTVVLSCGTDTKVATQPSQVNQGAALLEKRSRNARLDLIHPLILEKFDGKYLPSEACISLVAVESKAELASLSFSLSDNVNKTLLQKEFVFTGSEPQSQATMTVDFRSKVDKDPRRSSQPAS